MNSLYFLYSLIFAGIKLFNITSLMENYLAWNATVNELFSIAIDT